MIGPSQHVVRATWRAMSEIDGANPRMAAKYRQIDALVREGLAKPAEERAEWASALPPELAGKVLGIIEAPGWYDALPKAPVPPRRRRGRGPSSGAGRWRLPCSPRRPCSSG